MERTFVNKGSASKGEPMYLSSMTISGFRQFGTDNNSLTIPFNKGITALVGRNDSGKTAIIDAIRLVLLTRDHEYFRIQPEDFHINSDGTIERMICIQCIFSDLNESDRGAFLEYLSYEDEKVSLHIHWTATRNITDGAGRRRWLDINVKCGKNGTGPSLEVAAREMLAAAYLRPLRDAEREMSAGRNSRLSQILANLDSVKQGESFTHDILPDINHEAITKLSLLGFADFFAHHIKEHQGICEAKNSINNRYLKNLSVESENISGEINFVSASSEDFRLRQLLERLELKNGGDKGNLGLGSNNLLFIGCELLLLGSDEGFPILLIEEPEAHLHPQRQLRLMEFLNKATGGSEDTRQPVQVILTTHSPNLASRLPLASLILLADQAAFPLAPANTQLTKSDYSFLERFLDVTKANLFFAHGVIIVEGFAEAILLPTIAKLLGKDLTAHGVSIVNVGSTGLSRFSKIFQRKNEMSTHIPVPVACITDRDIMPDCAPPILGLIDSKNRKWRKESDDAVVLQKTIDTKCINDGQRVKTFVSNKWTFEYDLAYYGLHKEVYCAIMLAEKDEQLHSGKIYRSHVIQEAKSSFPNDASQERRSTNIYAYLKIKNISKTIISQHLSEILEEMVRDKQLSPQDFENLLPPYIVQAIAYATQKELGATHE